MLNRRLPLSALAIACTCCALALPAQAQRGAPAANPCQQLVDGVRGSRNLTDVNQRLQQRNPNPNTLKQCAPEIEREPSVARALQQQRQSLPRIARQQQQTLARQVANSPQVRELLKPRQDALRAGQQSRSRAQASARAAQRAGGPSGPGMGPWPTQVQIDSLEPERLTPGVDIVIRGDGFGGDSGTVTVRRSGKTFNAAVDHWSNTLILAKLDSEISGVTYGTSTLRVQRGDGQYLDLQRNFAPVWQALLLTEAQSISQSESPKNVVFFQNMTLNSPWIAAAFTGSNLSNIPGLVACDVELGSPIAGDASRDLLTNIQLQHPSSSASLACGIFASLLVYAPRGFDDPGVSGGTPVTLY